MLPTDICRLLCNPSKLWLLGCNLPIRVKTATPFWLTNWQRSSNLKFFCNRLVTLVIKKKWQHITIVQKWEYSQTSYEPKIATLTARNTPVRSNNRRKTDKVEQLLKPESEDILVYFGVNNNFRMEHIKFANLYDLVRLVAD